MHGRGHGSIYIQPGMVVHARERSHTHTKYMTMRTQKIHLELFILLHSCAGQQTQICFNPFADVDVGRYNERQHFGQQHENNELLWATQKLETLCRPFFQLHRKCEEVAHPAKNTGIFPAHNNNNSEPYREKRQPTNDESKQQQQQKCAENLCGSVLFIYFS